MCSPLINNNTDRTIDVVFSRFRGFSLAKILKAEAQQSYAHAALNDKTEREYARNSFRILPKSLL